MEGEIEHALGDEGDGNTEQLAQLIIPVIECVEHSDRIVALPFRPLRAFDGTGDDLVLCRVVAIFAEGRRTNSQDAKFRPGTDNRLEASLQ